MTTFLTGNNDRRAFLKLASGSALLIPLVGISACSKQEPAATASPDATPAATPEPVPASAPVPAPAPEVAPAPAATTTAAAPTGNLPHLDPDDPVAKALGYHQDASTIDAAKYPQHIAGQACHLCVQFKGGATDSWGPCLIFAGKQVNANGWCSAFAAKA